MPNLKLSTANHRSTALLLSLQVNSAVSEVANSNEGNYQLNKVADCQVNCAAPFGVL